LDILTLAPGEVANNNYYAQFDAFEFGFITSSDAVEISAWGKDTAGDLTVVHSMLPAELFPTGMERIAGAPGMTIPATLNQIYVPNSSSNYVSVIDGNTNAVITTVTVGTNPVGVGVNLTTHKIYVANQGSHNVSVIDGITNDVISTISVGAFPEGVNVNPTTNRIYITNQGSNNVSVINGSTNTVIATIDVGS